MPMQGVITFNEKEMVKLNEFSHTETFTGKLSWRWVRVAIESFPNGFSKPRRPDDLTICLNYSSPNWATMYQIKLAPPIRMRFLEVNLNIAQRNARKLV